MEPISSFVSARASASQAPVPVQQRQGNDSLTANLATSDAYTASAPVQELQLQRRQVVEDLGKSQNVQVQLQNAGSQLQQARTLATQGQAANVGSDTRQQLQSAFQQVGTNVNAIADTVAKSGNSSVDAASLRVNTSLNSQEEAREAGNNVDQALEQVESGLNNIQQQQQTLSTTFPRNLQTTNQAPIGNPSEASQVANQIQQQLRQQPDNALVTQANLSRQSTLSLFQ